MDRLTLVLIGGLPLSGKSTLGRKLSKATGIHYCDIDDLKKEAFGLPTREEYERRWANPEVGATWAGERTGMAYQLLHDGVVDIALSNGQSIMVGSTYSRASSQKFAKEIAERHDAVVRPIICRLSNETREEVERRMTRDIDDEYVFGCSTWNNYASDTARFEPLDGAGVFSPESVFVVDTSHPTTDEELQRIVAFIKA